MVKKKKAKKKRIFLYGKGRRNEYKARVILRKQGYLVFRSAGSKGPFDLLAIGKYILAIQVKTNRPPGKPEMTRLRKLEIHPVAWKQIWIFHDRVKEPEIIKLQEGKWLTRTNT